MSLYISCGADLPCLGTCMAMPPSSLAHSNDERCRTRTYRPRSFHASGPKRPSKLPLAEVFMLVADR